MKSSIVDRHTDDSTAASDSDRPRSPSEERGGACFSWNMTQVDLVNLRQQVEELQCFKKFAQEEFDARKRVTKKQSHQIDVLVYEHAKMMSERRHQVFDNSLNEELQQMRGKLAAQEKDVKKVVAVVEKMRKVRDITDRMRERSSSRLDDLENSTQKIVKFQRKLRDVACDLDRRLKDELEPMMQETRGITQETRSWISTQCFVTHSEIRDIVDQITIKCQSPVVETRTSGASESSFSRGQQRGDNSNVGHGCHLGPERFNIDTAAQLSPQRFLEKKCLRESVPGMPDTSPIPQPRPERYSIDTNAQDMVSVVPDWIRAPLMDSAATVEQSFEQVLRETVPSLPDHIASLDRALGGLWPTTESLGEHPLFSALQFPCEAQ